MTALEEKKAEDILLLDIQEVASFADYFIITTGTSERMLDSLAETAVDTARNKFKIHSKTQGKAATGWLVVDFGDIVRHLFSPEQRDYYQLEELWQDGRVLVRVQ